MGQGRLHEIGGLFARYRSIFHHAWTERKQRDTELRLTHELAFLPAHLELTESPPHPLPLWTGRLLLLLAVGIVLITILGRIDIVAVAPGQLIPNANVKIIQPAVAGVVRKILVQNGDRVTAGQELVELDSTQAGADADTAKTSRVDAELSLARAQALLLSQESNTEPKVEAVSDANAAQQTDSQRLAAGIFHEYVHKLLSLRAELARREAELATAAEEVTKLEQTAPLARKEADDYKELVQGKYVAEHEYVDKEVAAIQQARDLAAQQSRTRELAAGIDEQRRDIQATIASFQREQLETLNKAREDASLHEDSETKAIAHQSLMRLTSPVAGIVQQLNVHTIGGVVGSGQNVMEIVPDDTLEVEARISNKDIGFVNPGQSATVKIATFPYTRFGYLAGTVSRVSNDAISDRTAGLVFPARIRIPSNHFKVQDKWLSLSPGMQVSVEIKTGKQKLWQYFLGPLIQTGHESLRER